MNRTLKIIIGLLIVLVILVFSATVIISGAKKANTPQQRDNGPLGAFFSLFTGNSNQTGVNGIGFISTTTVQTENGQFAVIPRLRQIYAKPVAGQTFLIRNISTTTLDKQVLKPVTVPATFIRFVDRASGHVFETKPDSLSVTEISNTTLPKIYQAAFLQNGNALVLRYLDDAEVNIETYYGKLLAPVSASTSSAQATSSNSVNSVASSTTQYQLVGSLLQENIKDLVVSPTKDRFFYVQETTIGSKGVLATDAKTSNNKTIIQSPFREWSLQWPSTSNLVLTTKPSAGVVGYVFNLTTGGNLSRIFSGMAGLTTLSSPDLKTFLFSATAGNTFNLNLYNIRAGQQSALSLKTLPEKCVWSQKQTSIVYCAVPLIVPNGSYPDVWYQGAVSFEDNFWKINVQTGEQTLIAKPKELSQVNIDAINLSLDQNENYLMFTNKNDLSLWDLLINLPTPPKPVGAATSSAQATSTSGARATSTFSQ